MKLQMAEFGVVLELGAARLEGSKKIGCKLVEVLPPYREILQHRGTIFPDLEACLAKLRQELQFGCRFAPVMATPQLAGKPRPRMNPPANHRARPKLLPKATRPIMLR